MVFVYQRLYAITDATVCIGEEAIAIIGGVDCEKEVDKRFGSASDMSLVTASTSASGGHCAETRSH